MLQLLCDIFTSILNRLNPKLLQSLKVLLHGVELFGGVSRPVGDFPGYPERAFGMVGLGGIAR